MQLERNIFPQNKKVLVLGLGNDILTDDGIGPKLAVCLGHSLKNYDFACMTASCGGLELLELLRDYNIAVLIDAIKTKNGIPGTVYHFIPEDFRETTHLSSIHDVSFLTALKLGKKLNMKLPACIHIIAIEILEDMEFSTEFSTPLRNRFKDIKKEVRALTEKILQAVVTEKT